MQVIFISFFINDFVITDVKHMNLHEYQAKQLFAKYNLPVSQGIACASAREALDAAQKIGGNKWVIKCQVHAGGRGKAGGVKLVSSEAEIEAFADQWLGKNLVTFQTDAKGQPVHKILIESCTDIQTELYLSAVLDRASQRVVFMASTQGGMDIEKVAEEMPDQIHRMTLDPLTGPLPYQGRDLAFKLNLSGVQINNLPKFLWALVSCS